MTQPQIKDQLKELLWDMGISISEGEVNNLVIHNHEEFHAEKEEVAACLAPVYWLAMGYFRD